MSMEKTSCTVFVVSLYSKHFGTSLSIEMSSSYIVNNTLKSNSMELEKSPET